MPKKHPPYPPEFRRQMVELVRAGRTPEELSREFEPSAQAIHGEPGFPGAPDPQGSEIASRAAPESLGFRSPPLVTRHPPS
jgi:transposase